MGMAGNHIMKSNPDQMEQVKQKSEFRDLAQPLPIPWLLFLSMA